MPSTSQHHNVSPGAVGLPTDSDTVYDDCELWHETIDKTLVSFLSDLTIVDELKDDDLPTPQSFYLGDDEGEITPLNSSTTSAMEIDKTAFCYMDTIDQDLRIRGS